MPNGTEEGGLTLGVLGQQTSSPESRRRARGILEQYQTRGFGGEEELLERMKETAESSRTSLKEARERLLGRKYDPREKWLKLASAFGEPTRTGQFGETLGKAAGALSESLGQEREFERGRRTELRDIEGRMSGIDRDLLKSEFDLAKMRRTSESGLAKEALKILSRQESKPSPNQKVRDAALKTLDRTYTLDYNAWTSGGQARAAGNLARLQETIDQLKKSDKLTGPFLGNVPMALREVSHPKSVQFQQQVEGVVQSSLKEVLGSQFTAREGEQILARAYNPRLEEGFNIRKLKKLLKELQAATEAQNAKARYYTQHGTLKGYQGKIYTHLDFLTDDDDEKKTRKVKVGDKEFLVTPDATDEEIYEEYDRLEEKGFQEGGRVTRPPILEVEEEERPTIEDLRSAEESSIIPELLGMASGAGAGAGIGTLLGLRKGESRVPAERLIKAFKGEGRDPREALTRLKRSLEQGVPQTLSEQGGSQVQALAEEAITQGGAPAEEMLSEIEERRGGARERVTEQVEKSLGASPYFEQEQKLVDDLYSNSKPLYEEAYAKYPGLSEKDVPVIYEIMKTPDGKRAIKMALRLMRNQGKKIGREDAVGLVRKPSLEYLDMVKRGFDQLISKEENLGATTLGRSMRGLRNKLKNQLDEVAPEYKKARAQYAGDLEVIDALKEGRDTFVRRQPEEIQKMMNKFSEAEKDAYRTGASQKLSELVNTSTADINPAQKVMGSPMMKKRIRALFPEMGPNRFDLLELALETEREMFVKQKALARRGERGRTRRLTQEDPGVVPKVLRAVSGVSIVESLVRLFSAKKLNESEADELIGLISTSTPEEVDSTLKELTKAIEPVRERMGKIPGAIKKAATGKTAKVGTGVGAGVGLISEMMDDEEE